MEFCPAIAMSSLSPDIEAETWAAFLSRFTPDELEWIKEMLEENPDTVEKFLLVLAGSLSTWLGPLLLGWFRGVLVSVNFFDQLFLNF